MAKKTRYVPLDWSSESHNAPSTRQEGNTAPGISSLAQLSGAVRIASTLSPYTRNNPTKQVIDSMNTYLNQQKVDMNIICSDSDGSGLLASSSISPGSTTLPLTPLALATTDELQIRFGKLSLTKKRGISTPVLTRIPPSICCTTREGSSPLQLSTGRLYSSSLSGSYSLPPHQSQSALPSRSKTIYPRKPTQAPPVAGKVYFLPDGRHLLDSIIYTQKHQDGFFKHPVLVVDVEGDMVYFYAMTKEPPHAIRELNMALRLGTSNEDAGQGVLRLAPGSKSMRKETFVNLEQRFFIEWKNLDHWDIDAQVDMIDLGKIARRVAQLEADQNRFIYKPLLRAMSTMQPGMIIMLPNGPDASTLGAPVLIVETNYTDFRFLRIKRFEDNIHFNLNAKRDNGSTRAMCLSIAKQSKIRHDGTPVMLLEPGSPEMREASYVEINTQPKIGKLNRCKTWCWPPVQISMSSMATLCNYIADVSMQSAKPTLTYPCGEWVQLPHVPCYGNYYQPPTDHVCDSHWSVHGTTQ